MYKCEGCKFVFDEPNVETVEVGEYGGVPYYENEGFCPDCGSDEFDYVEECEMCEEYITKDESHLTDDLKYLCKNCYEEYESQFDDKDEDYE